MNKRLIKRFNKIRDELRELRVPYGDISIASEIGIHFGTLAIFRRGGSVSTRTIQKIESWIESIENRR